MRLRSYYTNSGLAFLSLFLLLNVSACKKPEESKEILRPVRVVQVKASDSSWEMEYPAEIKARVESRLGFRVAGKISKRLVELGSQVKKGQVLMQLDAQDYQLGQAQANAAQQSAKANRDLAEAEYKRYQELRDKNFVSQAVLDGKKAAYTAAQSTYQQTSAGLAVSSNQAHYTQLVADMDGLVTGIDAEIGQVVAAGTPVVRLAKSHDKDVWVALPEGQANQAKMAKEIKVFATSDESIQGKAKLRELSPAADSVTRTYLAKLSLIEDSANKASNFQLGMTVKTQWILNTPSSQTGINIPATALFMQNQQNMVWIYKDGVVELRKVAVKDLNADSVLISSGLQAGETVVTAGVNLLKPGQKVKVLQDNTSSSGVAK